MDKFDIVDLIRAMAKKCEDFEHEKSRAEMYHRWYKDAQEEVEELKARLKSIEA